MARNNYSNMVRERLWLPLRTNKQLLTGSDLRWIDMPIHHSDIPTLTFCPAMKGGYFLRWC